MTTTNLVIIVAAGIGSRMGGDVPKQFRLLGEFPVLMHTIERFHQSETRPAVILVLSESMVSYWKALCRQHHFTRPHQICLGGDSRFQSVREGLRFIEETITVTPRHKIAVHDGARPLTSTKLIDSLYKTCHDEKPAVIPATQSVNSIRLGNQQESKALQRDLVWIVQTPQVFLAEPLINAYRQPESEGFTDDASVFETQYKKLYLHPGDPYNMKITLEDDIAIAHQLMTKTR